MGAGRKSQLQTIARRPLGCSGNESRHTRPGEGSLADRLGYQTFDQFLKDIPSLRIEGIEPIRYVTLSSADEFDESENAN